MRKLPQVRRPLSAARRKAAAQSAPLWLLPTHYSLLTTRSGVTLSEVLVSLLVMSIGVVALASLFPISVLRSIQASQMTNAANLRYNAEAHIRAIPQLINIGEEWQATTTYAAGDIVVPTLEVRRKSPAAAYQCTQAGMSGGAEPTWNLQQAGTTNDGAAQWQTYRLKNYIVDPLAYHLVDPGNGLGYRAYFGNDGAGTAFNPFLNPPATRRLPIYRFAGVGANNEVQAAAASVLPDSWLQLAESLQFNNLTATSIDLNDVKFDGLIDEDANRNGVLDGGEDLNGNGQLDSGAINLTDRVLDRIVFIDETGRRSQARTITGLAPNGNYTRVTWQANQPLPTGFDLDFTDNLGIAKVRLESQERRYTQMLSVRRSATGAAHIDVVVGFRRGYSPLDEQVYSAVFRRFDPGPDGAPGVSGVNDDGRNGTDDAGELGFAGSDDQPVSHVIVQYNSTGNKPFFKKGGFVCDAVNLRWYRITDTFESPLPAATPTIGIQNVTPAGFQVDSLDPAANKFVRLTLEQPIQENSADVTGTILGGAILMKGVVDVFPLRPQMPWEE